MKFIFFILINFTLLFSNEIVISFQGGQIDFHEEEKVNLTFLKIKEGEVKKICLNGDIIKNKCLYVAYKFEGIYFNYDPEVKLQDRRVISFIPQRNWKTKQYFNLSLKDVYNDIFIKNIKTSIQTTN